MRNCAAAKPSVGLANGFGGDIRSELASIKDTQTDREENDEVSGWDVGGREERRKPVQASSKTRVTSLKGQVNSSPLGLHNWSF